MVITWPGCPREGTLVITGARGRVGALDRIICATDSVAGGLVIETEDPLIHATPFVNQANTFVPTLSLVKFGGNPRLVNTNDVPLAMPAGKWRLTV